MAFSYFGILFSQPRRQDKIHIRKLRLHFMSFVYTGIGVYIMREVKRDRPVYAVGWGITAVVVTLVFHLGLKLRAIIGRLPDEGKKLKRSEKLLFYY